MATTWKDGDFSREVTALAATLNSPDESKANRAMELLIRACAWAEQAHELLDKE